MVVSLKASHDALKLGLDQVVIHLLNILNFNFFLKRKCENYFEDVQLLLLDVSEALLSLRVCKEPFELL